MFTGERLVPHEAKTAEELILELRHRFAYETASRFSFRGARALDIGCGHGYGVALLRDRGLRSNGLEVALEALAATRGACGAAGCAAYDGRRLPIGDDSIDVATCFQVIEHVIDPTVLAAEISRVLRPEGTLFMTTPNRLLRLGPSERPWNRFHLREYDAGDLHDLLAPWFASVRIVGVRATPGVETLELARLRSIRRFVALDPLRLRNALPEGINRPVRAFLRRLAATSRRRPAWRGFSVGDFRLEEDGVEEAMDLFAICGEGPRPRSSNK